MVYPTDLKSYPKGILLFGGGGHSILLTIDP